MSTALLDEAVHDAIGLPHADRLKLIEFVSNTFDEEELLEMALEFPKELVDGVLMEKPPMAMISSYYTGRLSTRLGNFADDHDLGVVLEGHTSYRCFPHKPAQVRRPDLSFIRRDRVTRDIYEGHVPIRPDLAVEVTSPGDRVRDLEGRIADYLAAGVPLIWVLHPPNDIVRVYHADNTALRLVGEDVLSGEHILPGFEVRVAELFVEPRTADAAGM